MNCVVRSLSIAGCALVLLTTLGLGQSTNVAPTTLHALILDLEAHPGDRGPQWAAELDTPVNGASIREVEQELPALVGLTESPDAQQRSNALLVLLGIAGRQKAGA